MQSTFAAFLLALVVVTPTFGMPGDNATCPVNYICYAIDQSTSIGTDFFSIEQQFVIDLSIEISSRTSNASYSAFRFSSTLRTTATSTTDLEGAFVPAIRNSNVGGETNIDVGFEACFNELQSQGTPQDNKILVLITDGIELTDRATELRQQAISSGISIVTVGIGNRVDATSLTSLATNSSFFVQSDFDTLIEDENKVVDLTCMAAMTGPDAFATPTPVTGCAKAYSECGFSFANGPESLRTFPLGNVPDRPFTPAIISKNVGETLGVVNMTETLGVVNMNGFVPEFIGNDGSVLPINVAGAQPQYTPTHFKPYVFNNSFASGVGHQTFHGNQMTFAKGQCIRLHFSHYQTLKSVQPLIIDKNFNNVPVEADKCVVFRIAN